MNKNTAPEESLEVLRAGIAALGLDDLPPEIPEALLAYAKLLRKWNAVYNLTAIRGEEKTLSHHLLDALAVLPYLEPDTPSLLDVGSGGGIPGLVLALARPRMAVTLIDSNGKKAAFLRQAAIELGLRNVRVQAARVEAFSPEERFPAIISRAFADLAGFVLPTRHLLLPGGSWWAMKGLRPDAEIAALPQGIEVAAFHPLKVPGVEAERCLLQLQER
ncbi:MAG: 16S rRNA (guanine(527)-N(7))-methyltransferase RsmG [Betaproteobacteria bacterium]|nr:16S rRNA (guanine(527)-N(7))-methyltransferase RsmG [Betaproteobacteria bacterium]